MRIVNIDLSQDEIQPKKIFGGYAKEHKETELAVTLPQRLITEDIAYYYFEFQTIYGNHLVSPSIPKDEITNNTVKLFLWEQLIPQAGDLIFCVTAVQKDADGAISVKGKTASCILQILNSPNGENEIINPTATKEELQTMIDALISEEVDTVTKKIGLMTFKGVTSSSNLPTENVNMGDAYYLFEKNALAVAYVYNGTVTWFKTAEIPRNFDFNDFTDIIKYRAVLSQFQTLPASNVKKGDAYLLTKDFTDVNSMAVAITNTSDDGHNEWRFLNAGYKTNNIGYLYNENLEPVQKICYRSIPTKNVVFDKAVVGDKKAFNGIVTLQEIVQNGDYYTLKFDNKENSNLYTPSFGAGESIPENIFKGENNTDHLTNILNAYGYSAAGFNNTQDDTQVGALKVMADTTANQNVMGATFLYRCFTKTINVRPNRVYELSFDFALPNNAPFNGKTEYSALPLMNNLTVCGEEYLISPGSGNSVHYKQVGNTFVIDKDYYTQVPCDMWFPKNETETYDKNGTEYKTIKLKFNSGNCQTIHICFAFQLGDKIIPDYSNIPITKFKNFRLVNVTNEKSAQFQCDIPKKYFESEDIKEGNRFYFKRGTVIDYGTEKAAYTSVGYLAEFGKIN